MYHQSVIQLVDSGNELSLDLCKISRQRLDVPAVYLNHIADLMIAGGVLMGGEESGGISVKGHIPEGDGVLMGRISEMTSVLFRVVKA